jgi:AcrR family transcriptional regulator
MLDRSQRRRAATRTEIKAAARDQLVRGGPGSISLRAVARDMGLTAPALYRYYPALDSLVLELCTDLYAELRLACETARDRVPEKDLIARLQAMAWEFRWWVLAHPPEAALMFGPPLPGLQQFIDQCAELQNAGACLGRLFIDPMLELHAQGRLPAPKVFVGPLREHADLPEPVAAFFLSAWTRIYGAIMAEAFGHLSWAVPDGAAVFEAELQALTESLVSKNG